MDCIFCKIVVGELPTSLVHETEHLLIIKDIQPKAPVHVLLIPKKHIATLDNATGKDKDLLGEMLLTAKEIAAKAALDSKSE